MIDARIREAEVEGASKVHSISVIILAPSSFGLDVGDRNNLSVDLLYSSIPVL